MAKLFLPVLLGTTRRGNYSQHAARYVLSVASEFEEVETELVNPAELDFPADGNEDYAKDPRYSELTKRADGFFVVTPEYNHGIPGSLKRMLDSELENYIHKPVAMAGVSAGPWGGVRAIEAFVPIARELGLVTSFADVMFPRVQHLFDASGTPSEDILREPVVKAWKELIWLARTLRWGRESL